LSWIVGSKFEHNSYTGFELEPSSQLVWTPSPRHTLWTGVARAIRQPSQTDVALDYTSSPIPVGNGLLGVARVFGSPNIKAEELRDVELGYRAQLSRRFTLDAVGFLSH